MRCISESATDSSANNSCARPTEYTKPVPLTEITLHPHRVLRLKGELLLLLLSTPAQVFVSLQIVKPHTGASCAGMSALLRANSFTNSSTASCAPLPTRKNFVTLCGEPRRLVRRRHVLPHCNTFFCISCSTSWTCSICFAAAASEIQRHGPSESKTLWLSLGALVRVSTCLITCGKWMLAGCCAANTAPVGKTIEQMNIAAAMQSTQRAAIRISAHPRGGLLALGVVDLILALLKKELAPEECLPSPPLLPGGPCPSLLTCFPFWALSLFCWSLKTKERIFLRFSFYCDNWVRKWKQDIGRDTRYGKRNTLGTCGAECHYGPSFPTFSPSALLLRIAFLRIALVKSLAFDCEQRMCAPKCHGLRKSASAQPRHIIHPYIHTYIQVHIRTYSYTHTNITQICACACARVRLWCKRTCSGVDGHAVTGRPSQILTCIINCKQRSQNGQ